MRASCGAKTYVSGDDFSESAEIHPHPAPLPRPPLLLLPLLLSFSSSSVFLTDLLARLEALTCLTPSFSVHDSRSDFFFSALPAPKKVSELRHWEEEGVAGPGGLCV